MGLIVIMMITIIKIMEPLALMAKALKGLHAPEPNRPLGPHCRAMMARELTSLGSHGPGSLFQQNVRAV